MSSERESSATGKKAAERYPRVPLELRPNFPTFRLQGAWKGQRFVYAGMTIADEVDAITPDYESLTLTIPGSVSGPVSKRAWRDFARAVERSRRNSDAGVIGSKQVAIDGRADHPPEELHDEPPTTGNSGRLPTAKKVLDQGVARTPHTTVTVNPAKLKERTSMYNDASRNPMTAIDGVGALLGALEQALLDLPPATRYPYQTGVDVEAYRRLLEQYAELVESSGRALLSQRAGMLELEVENLKLRAALRKQG